MLIDDPLPYWMVWVPSDWVSGNRLWHLKREGHQAPRYRWKYWESRAQNPPENKWGRDYITDRTTGKGGIVVSDMIAKVRDISLSSHTQHMVTLTHRERGRVRGGKRIRDKVVRLTLDSGGRVSWRMKSERLLVLMACKGEDRGDSDIIRITGR